MGVSSQTSGTPVMSMLLADGPSGWTVDNTTYLKVKVLSLVVTLVALIYKFDDLFYKKVTILKCVDGCIFLFFCLLSQYFYQCCIKVFFMHNSNPRMRSNGLKYNPNSGNFGMFFKFE